MNIVPILIYIFTGVLCFKLGIIVGFHCKPNAPDEEASE